MDRACRGARPAPIPASWGSRPHQVPRTLAVVTDRRRLAQAEADVARRCRRGLDVAGVHREVLGMLRRVMPVDAAFLATADPETLLFTGAHTEAPLDSATALFLDNEYGDGDVNTFAGLAAARTHVGTLDAATRGERGSSSRYRDIMRPLGLGDELRAALVVDRQCWGFLCLHRADSPLGFTESEAATLARLGPHLAHALRHAALLRASAAAGDVPRPGVVVLDEHLDPISSTPEAEHLLSLLPPSGRLPLPVPVYAVAAALTRPGAAPPTARVLAADGRWLELHASRLASGPDSGRTAVVVEAAAPRSAAQILVAAYGLSPRERDVARLVLRGASTRAISAELHIGAHTVQDHLKSVFDKVGVRSRRDLVALLLAGTGPH